MRETITARQGETLDAAIWRGRRLGPADLSAVLALNPGLADRGAVLPTGTIVTVPAASRVARDRGPGRRAAVGLIMTGPTAAEIFGQLAAGLRLALALLAFSVLMTIRRRSTATADASVIGRARRYNEWAWTLISLSVLSFSPLRSGQLLGYPAAEWVTALGDVAASGGSCIALILVLAMRGVSLGLSRERIRRGMQTNAAVVAAIVTAAWMTR